jgi:hypothetical protein
MVRIVVRQGRNLGYRQAARPSIGRPAPTLNWLGLGKDRTVTKNDQ